MKKFKLFAAAGAVCLTAAAFPVWGGQASATPGVSTSIVVTLEPKSGNSMAPVDAQDIRVMEGHDKRPVTGFVPLGPDSPMQLLLLIDDSARGSFDTEIGTLKQFVNSLPQNTSVAVGYMRNGMTQFAQTFTRDHAAAANSIRVSLGPGGEDVSPYDSLTDAIKHWPKAEAQRKEVVMISSGIEGLGGGYVPENPYVNAGIHSAQQAGVVVYTIYSPSVGHWGHSYWRYMWGQNFLSQLADETGGESYWIGMGSPVSFQPFLQQITVHLQHQYLLTFLARPEQKSGWQPIRVTIPDKSTSIAAPDRVYVKAGV